MKIKLLKSELSKGESWEEKDKREIRIEPSINNKGMRPSVCFFIFKGKNNKWFEDFFLNIDIAEKIGKELVRQSKSIRKNWREY